MLRRLCARYEGARRVHITIYRSGLTLAEEGEREKVAKIERSMLRGATGDTRGAEFELPRRGRRGLRVGGGVGWEDEAGHSPDGSSTFNGWRSPGDSDTVAARACPT
jgi:hypothetical protein